MLIRMVKFIAMVATGLFLAVMSYQIYHTIKTELYLASDISTKFEVNAIVVPDHILGEDPFVIYDRDIKMSFIGDYRVELKNVQTGATECIGSGTNIKYDAGEKSPKNITLTWFIGGLCSHPELITVGQHYLEVNYAIREEGFPERYLYAKSNVFIIFPPGYVPLTKLTVQDQVDRGIVSTDNLTLIP